MRNLLRRLCREEDGAWTAWQMFMFTAMVLILGLGSLLLAAGNEVIELVRWLRTRGDANSPTTPGAFLNAATVTLAWVRWGRWR